MKHYTRVLARVDLDAVEYNIEMMKKNIQKDTQMMAVIKMDGYGHGAVLVVVSVDVAVQVILAALVGGLHDGVLQHGVGTVYIAHHVGVLRLHLIEVHGNALRIGILGLLVLL